MGCLQSRNDIVEIQVMDSSKQALRQTHVLQPAAPPTGEDIDHGGLASGGIELHSVAVQSSDIINSIYVETSHND
eukprot:scaffold426695_cov20-Prasinocladus_malaysianus.AAC.2